MQRRAVSDVESVLRELNTVTVESVPGAQYGCITVVGDKIESVGPTHPYPVLLDDVQRETGEGPCLSAAWEHHTISIENLDVDDRWPQYRDAAILRTPVRSVLSFRLFSEGGKLAALNLYAEPTHAFDEESVEIGLIYAAHTTVAWNMMRRQQQFRSALASRDVIGQAKGILMERFDINAMAAFDLLRKISQESNIRLAEVAERLVNLDHPNDENGGDGGRRRQTQKGGGSSP
ncbi:GAF and ANTAR domain-containing protein [Mycobacterium sp. SMC-8]|uniref:GAF and ANTAR domain-containing protein n=1 Tax=Mycobacterium sp. SMC-8 TaxID=2857060 RepID=UPI0021B37B19|nr:GAF and ANTAR domain-containing protein [Mycobacterium sp. SMC-8]UXA15474.1 GAF and ANTAR domain-containing protein [Mycobacterium sp. SMC-8]